MVANMRRASLTIALLLVLALAVPASAATWRTYGTVRAGGGGETSASTAAADVDDIQLGDLHLRHRPNDAMGRLLGLLVGSEYQLARESRNGHYQAAGVDVDQRAIVEHSDGCV